MKLIVSHVGKLREDRTSEIAVALRRYLNERLSALSAELINASAEDFARVQGAAREVKKILYDIDYQPINPEKDTD